MKSHRPGKNKHGFEIEDHEEHGDEIKLNGYRNLCRTDMHHTRFKRFAGGALHFGFFAEQGAERQNNAHQDKNRDKIKGQRPERGLSHRSPPMGIAWQYGQLPQRN